MSVFLVYKITVILLCKSLDPHIHMSWCQAPISQVYKLGIVCDLASHLVV